MMSFTVIPTLLVTKRSCFVDQVLINNGGLINEIDRQMTREYK